MSNRKLRTSRADFLYLMAREGKRFFSAADERDVLMPLEKAGLVARGRTQARDVAGNWKGDRRRNTFWEITEKGWAVLRRRGSSNDQRMRVHHHDRNVYYRVERFANRLRIPLHEVIVETINYPEPGEIKLGRAFGRGPAKRRGRY